LLVVEAHYERTAVLVGQAARGVDEDPRGIVVACCPCDRATLSVAPGGVFLAVERLGFEVPRASPLEDPFERRDGFLAVERKVRPPGRNLIVPYRPQAL
jgi:hypothetical protein